MFFLTLLPFVLACAYASSVNPIHGVTIGITPYSHPVLSQYHAQDNFGHYVYGYATPTASKSETKTADGVTHGGYSYIDSNGHLQTVQYTADPIHGFTVAASNLPVDLPDVAYEKAKHIAQYEAIKAEHAALAAKIVAQYSNPIVVPYASVPPLPVQELPEVAKARAEHFAAIEATRLRDAQIAAEHAALAAERSAQAAELSVQAAERSAHAVVSNLAANIQGHPQGAIASTSAAALSPIPLQITGNVVPVHAGAVIAAPIVNYATKSHHISYTPAVSTQYHTQDSIGQYSYGYAGPWSAKSETRTADGVTRGGYSYIDAHGVLQTVHYVADAIHGFRVAASNLPVAAGANPDVQPLVEVAPVAVESAVPIVHASVGHAGGPSVGPESLTAHGIAAKLPVIPAKVPVVSVNGASHSQVIYF